MIRTYSYLLLPNKIQERTLNSYLVACQQLYNAALEQRITCYKSQHRSLSLYDQQKQLTELRQSDSVYRSISVEILRSALIRLDNAYRSFFRRCKSGETPGFPRFRSRQRYDSLSFGSTNPVIVTKNRIKIPNFGNVKFNLHRKLPKDAEILDVKVKRSSTNRWYVHFSLRLANPAPQAPREIKTSIGIDLGLTTFAMLSTGEAVVNPRYFQYSQELLAHRQRELARKQRTSNNRLRSKVLVAKAHEHSKNQRKDFARKLAKQLVNQYDVICYEDLQIANMTRSNLGKSINDAGWGIFIQCLVNKAEEAGSQAIAVNPHGTSQICSGCGKLVKKTLSERVHGCSVCYLVMDRDLNASINIKARGLRALEVI